MSTTQGNTEPFSADPAEQDPGARDAAADVKVQLQLAIFEVTRDAKGKSLDEIRNMLLSAFTRRGVAAPPNTWLDSVASSAVYGQPYVIDYPAAMAADDAMPAPNENLRRRLASRRKLRQEKLPAGIFPSQAESEAGSQAGPGSINPGRRSISRAVGRRAGGPPTALSVAALAAAAVVAVLAFRAAGRRLAARPGNGNASTARKAPLEGHDLRTVSEFFDQEQFRRPRRAAG